MEDRTNNVSLSLHQKLDFLIDGNTQQSRGMDTLRTENQQLQKELEEMKENMQSLKSQISSTPTVTIIEQEFHQLCLLRYIVILMHLSFIFNSL